MVVLAKTGKLQSHVLLTCTSWPALCIQCRTHLISCSCVVTSAEQVDSIGLEGRGGYLCTSQVLQQLQPAAISNPRLTHSCESALVVAIVASRES
jgi:hypothetical protein